MDQIYSSSSGKQGKLAVEFAGLRAGLLAALSVLACGLTLACGLLLAPASLAAPPIEGQPSTITPTAGQQFNGQVGVISVQGYSLESMHGQGTITWGDGQTSPAEVQVERQRAILILIGHHTYISSGVYHGSVAGKFEDSQASGTFTAQFTANVGAGSTEESTTTSSTTSSSTTTTQTTVAPPPPPPPTVHAAFTVASLTPGHAVLDASASVPPGTSVTSYRWNVSGSAQPDAVCTGSQPQLTVNTHGALDTTVSLTATDAEGVATTARETLAIPTPLVHASRAARAAATITHTAPASTRATVGTPVSPSFAVVGECSGASHPALAPLTSAGARLVAKGVGLGVRPLGSIGAPPEECNQDVEFGAADVLGCLAAIEEPNQLPGGITTALAGLLCGSHDKSFCTQALSVGVDAGTSLLGDAASLTRTKTPDMGARSASIVEQQAAAAVPSALKRFGFPSYYSWTAIRVDGLDIDPRNGQPILVIPSASIVVSEDASIYLDGHEISPLHTIALYLPSAGGTLGELSLPGKLPIIGSLPFTGSIRVDMRRAGSTLPNGSTCPFDCAAVSVNAALPGVFSDGEGHGLSAGAVITADNQQGLQLNSLEVKIPHAEIAGIGVDNVDFRYQHSDDSLRGEATLDLLASGEITARFAFVHGGFQEGHVSWDAGAGPGIDLGGPIPIFLTRLGGGITVNPPVLSAEGAIAGGGDVLGCSLFGISGTLTIQFAPFELNANAAGELLCNQVAEEYFHVDEAGDIGLGGNVHIEIYVLSFEAGIAFEVSQGHFQFDGNVNACIKILGEHCLGAEVVVSDHGVGVCADLGFTHAGAGIVFPDETHFMLDSCDIAQFRSLPMPANLARTAQALPSFTVPRGQSVAAIGVLGAGGAPNVTLRGPDGRTIATPADGYLKDPNEVVIADGRKTMETYFFVNHPAPGRWQIVADPGSVPVSAVRQAAALPSPDLHARVKSVHGGREQLRYSLRAIPGQQVTFTERQKGHGFRVLGRAHGSRGTIVFTPSSTLARRREIVAEVSQNGEPREDLTLAHYQAPAPPRLPAPRGLRAKRAADTVSLRWHAVAGASGYLLSVRRAKGATQYYALGARGHARTLSATLSIPRDVAVKLSVAGQRPGKGHRAGRRATVGLRAGPRPRGVAVKPIVQ